MSAPPPRFVPAPVPAAERPRTGIAPGAPTCCACPDMSTTVDADTGFCVGCWRATVLAAWWVRASRPQMVVVQARDELAAARDARTPPILTDESSPSGVGLKIGLEPPSPGKKR